MRDSEIEQYHERNNTWRDKWCTIKHAKPTKIHATATKRLPLQHTNTLRNVEKFLHFVHRDAICLNNAAGDVGLLRLPFNFETHDAIFATTFEFH